MNQILKRAADIIRNPEHWTQGSNARDALGNKTSLPTSSHARCWCARGAIIKACMEQPWHSRPQPNDIIDELERNHLHRPLWAFNDYYATKHQDVVDLLDKAAGAQP